MFGKRLAFTPVIIAFICMVTLFICLPAYAHQEACLQVKGKMVEADPVPFIVGNRVMVPVREVASALGADISWNEDKQAVKVIKGENQITMFIGQFQASVNGNDVKLEIAPIIVDGRAMVPVRVLAEGLQVPLSWDIETRVVSFGNLALIAGSSLDFPPFEFKEGDEIVGFEIDLIRAVEEVLGEEIIVKDISFDQLIPSLRFGQIDMIISGLTIVEQRKEVIDFTIPCFNWGEIILSPKGGNKNIVLQDLAGKKIAFQGGSHAQELVSDLQKNNPDTQIKAYDSLEEVWAAVEEGAVEAAVVPHAPTAYYLTNHGESSLQMAGEIFSIQPTAIAVQKGNQELLNKLNKSLETIKENGTYDRIYEKWFGANLAFKEGQLTDINKPQDADMNWQELAKGYNPPRIDGLLRAIVDSDIAADGSIVLTPGIKREFNQMGNDDYLFFFMPNVTWYDFESTGAAVSYMLFAWTGELGAFAENAPKYEAEARLRKIFAAPDNKYPSLEHKTYTKYVRLDGESYSLWPESYNDSTMVYDLTELRMRKDGEFTYYTASANEYQFDLNSNYEPGENEKFLSTRAKALSLNNAATLAKLLENGQISAAVKRSTYTIEFRTKGNNTTPMIVSVDKYM